MSVAFDKLSNFLLHKMQMSHIYQPVMLMHLLENGGQASVTEIARAILLNDPTQVEYYEEITRRMPGRVLTKNRGITDRDGSIYHLKQFDDLSKHEIDNLIEICQQKLANYLKLHREWRWSHRRQSNGYISASNKLKVLLEAKHRCLLCGKLEGDTFLTVDHIIPRKFGGGDDIENLQALCLSCNSLKNANDDTDLRRVTESYDDRSPECPYCDILSSNFVSDSALCYSINDSNPVATGHLLIIPKRHVSDYFDLYQPDRNDIERLLASEKTSLQAADESITGFNVGFDSGKDAGQAVSHCHLHLIPRRKGDSNSPRTGIRAAIPV